MKRFIVFLISITMCCVNLFAISKSVKAKNTISKITVDGKLNEKIWKTAGVINNLVQQKPNPGEHTKYKTVVKVLKTKKKLYFGIECFDPEPDKISIHTLKRDGDFRGDDYIQIILDTFEDGRRGFAFGVNAGGARQDGLISNPMYLSRDWDGIWFAKTSINENGWTAEIVIPSLSLRFIPGKKRWKMELKRYIPRDRIVLRWVGTTLDSARYDVKKTGNLLGMDDFAQGVGLSVSPYGVTKYDKDFSENTSSLKGTVGLDLKYSLTPSLTGILTLNTDFAETEVDDRKINLTRFSLFFPEKREFFLEGSNMFDFGTGLRREFLPFYSRRIGLYDNKIIPIDYGLKVLGTEGNLGIAFLNVQTRDSQDIKGTNLFAGRVTYQFGKNLQVGTIITDGDPDGVSKNTLIGVDVLWNTSSFRGDKNFNIGGWFAENSGDVEEGRKTGYGFKVDYPNDLFNIYAEYKNLGEALNPALGFNPRPGIEKYRVGIAFKPRPKKQLSKYVRQFNLEFYPSMTKNLKGEIESWGIFTAPLNFRTPKGAHYEINAFPRYEFLEEGYEISDGINVPAGKYHFTRYRVSAESPESNQFKLSSEIWFGDFYNGKMTQIELGCSWSSSDGSFNVKFDTESYIGDLDTGSFIERVYELKTIYSFSPDLTFSSFTQYDSDSRDVGINNRLRWTIKPGRDIFIVWNYGWYREFDRPITSIIPQYNQVTIKIRWTWRK